VREWVEARGLGLVVLDSPDDLMARALRGRPTAVVLDARTAPAAAHGCCRRLKSDSYTGVIPAAVLAAGESQALRDAFDAGADEVIREALPPEELQARLDTMLRRAERDVQVHPSTRLPGAPEIEAEIARRLEAGEKFAVCYADLDHFKEYNDRYSYFEGDRVIRILAKILHDVVKGTVPERGFVGHIGGDDFIFIIPVPEVQAACAEIVAIFDALVPYQYSEQDRRAGYFFGKDRRGQLHRVPLMTVSIGIVTNERRTFTHSSQVSELATEMKSYAKTLPGSVYIMDRRQDAGVDAAVGAGER
jgi:PleD family two-component response regulator